MPMYFWKDGEAAVLSDDAENFVEDYDHCHCVDTTCKAESLRYGWWKNSEWVHIPFNEFPAEFKTHLLLLGVT